MCLQMSFLENCRDIALKKQCIMRHFAILSSNLFLHCVSKHARHCHNKSVSIQNRKPIQWENSFLNSDSCKWKQTPKSYLSVDTRILGAGPWSVWRGCTPRFASRSCRKGEFCQLNLCCALPCGGPYVLHEPPQFQKRREKMSTLLRLLMAAVSGNLCSLALSTVSTLLENTTIELKCCVVLLNLKK